MERKDCCLCKENLRKTRLHSSRMRTARALTISPSMLCAGGGKGRLLQGGCLVRGGASAPGGDVCSRGVHSGGGLLRGMPGQGGLLLGGGGAWSGGWYPSMH